MNVEIAAQLERANDVIVTAQSFPEFAMEHGDIGVGMKIFDGTPGEFRYEWFVTDMDKDEARRLIAALQLAVELQADPVGESA